MHLNDLIAAPQMLRDYQILVIPGGFSFGDDIASGKVLAVKLRASLLEPLRDFVDGGRLVLGICNGFQVLVKLGLLPNIAGECRQDVTLTFNDSGRFEDRWVYLTVNPASSCVFTMGMDRVYLPVRHGEGKFIPRDLATLATLEAQHCHRHALCGPGRPVGGISLESQWLGRECGGDVRCHGTSLRTHAPSRSVPTLYESPPLDSRSGTSGRHGSTDLS